MSANLVSFGLAGGAAKYVLLLGFGAAAGSPVFPGIGDVRLGITYGPTGADYTGTLVVGGTSSAYTPRRQK